MDIMKMFLGVLLSLILGFVRSDKPCAPRPIRSQSVVCVCNATYCDDVTRLTPPSGTFVLYTSSMAGDRFKTTNGSLETYDNSGSYSATVKLDTSKTYQTIQGFGGAVTDAASINWKNVSEAVQQHLINSYCSSSGLEYNMLRVPIGGSDFSEYPYAYNSLPEDDVNLSNFSLTYQDFDNKIPMINACMSVATAPVNVVGTTWSPPTWMKTSNEYSGFSRLKSQYYQTYADYHLKFIEEYSKSGVPIWAITTTNEPFNGVVPILRFNSLGWTPSEMAQFIDENLGPTIRNSTFNATKILCLDDQRITIPIWFDYMVDRRPSTLQWIDGVAVHWYTDFITPATFLDVIWKEHPDKFILATEACEGSNPWQLSKVKLGSWSRAESYINSIITDLSHRVVGWLDWNMALNPSGGPNWAKNFVDSPIIVFAENDEFVKQPMFYAMGHFSKFVPRGSKMVNLNISGWHVKGIAFVTPRDTVVVVLWNKSNTSKSIRVKIGDLQAVIKVPGRSFNTVELQK